MAIDHISVGDVESITKINQSIDKSNLVDGKAEQAALQSEIDARSIAIAAIPLPMPVHTRPGEASVYYTTSLSGGDPTALPNYPSSGITFDDAGFVVRVSGDGIVASRALYPVEPGRKYLIEYAVQRRVNSPDPDNDAIRCALAWYDQTRGTVSQTVVQNLLGVTTGSGRLTVTAVVSRAAGSDVNVVAPDNARYCRPYVQTFGTLVRSDVEVIRWTDITNVSAFSPDLTALTGQVTALESVDAGDRLTALEGQVTAPNNIRLATVGDLVAAHVPVSADTVELLGYSSPGDGGGATYVRVASEPPHPGKIQSADGAWWEIAENIIDIRMLGAVLDGTDNGHTAAWQALAAIPRGDMLVDLPAGDIFVNASILFQDKNLCIRGHAVGLTRLHFSSSTAKIGFLDTSTGPVAKKIDVANFTLFKDYVTSPLDGSVGIEAQWSFTGVIASWEHASFRNITAQANGSTKYWDTAIKLIDAGVVRAINCRLDNAGADASGSRAFFELERRNATSTCSFHFVSCFAFGTTAGIRLTHASAPAGTIEGVYLTDCEFPGCRYGIYDDNEGTLDTTHTINDVKWVAGHANISRALMMFGDVTNLFVDAGNFTFGSLMDSSPALEAAVVIRTFAESILISGNRFLRDSGAATGKPVVLLPTALSTKSVRILGNSIGGWGAVVDQTGTPTNDRNRILVADNAHENIPLSGTSSGYEVNAPQIVAQSAVAIPLTGTVTETTLVTVPILGGSIGPNGRLRITTTWSFTNNVNSKSLRVRLGGTQIWSRSEGANVSARHSTEMANRNSLTSQVTNSGSAGGGWGPVVAAVTTTAIDTSASRSLTITAQLGNSGDTITLESYLVELLYGE